MEWVRSTFLNRTESKSSDDTSKSYDETNGLIFNDTVLPEEIILMILSYTDAKTTLKCKLVCRKWNELIKTHHFWRLKLSHTHKIVKSNVPWYAYYCYSCNQMFDKNLLKNGNGEEKYKHWKNVQNRGDGWVVENVPHGADLLPENKPEFNGKTSCFATSYQVCRKKQIIDFKKNQLFRQILDECQPTVYVSEWFAGRFDCGCFYKLGVRLYDENNQILYEKEELRTIDQWAGKAWEKVELSCNKYGKGVSSIEFYHEGSDSQFWAGHYGSKMAGGVLKIMFDFS